MSKDANTYAFADLMSSIKQRADRIVRMPGGGSDGAALTSSNGNLEFGTSIGNAAATELVHLGSMDEHVPKQQVGVFLGEPTRVAIPSVKYGDNDFVMVVKEDSDVFHTTGLFNRQVFDLPDDEQDWYPEGSVIFTYTYPSGADIHISSDLLVEVWHWGDNARSIQFPDCINLEYVPERLPLRMTSAQDMFRNCVNFNSESLEYWNPGIVVNMTDMFNGASMFNRDLSGWCVSNVSAVPEGFDTGASAWSLPRPVWGTCSAGFQLRVKSESISGKPGVYNDYDLSKIPTSFDYNSLHMTPQEDGHTLVSGTLNGTRMVIRNWDGLVEVLSWSSDLTVVNFEGCRDLVSVPAVLPNQVTSLANAFIGCTSSIGTELAGWDVSRVTSLVNTFRDASRFNADISGWDTSSLVNMNGMLAGATSFTRDISGWDTSNVTDV